MSEFVQTKAADQREVFRISAFCRDFTVGQMCQISRFQMGRQHRSVLVFRLAEIPYLTEVNFNFLQFTDKNVT